MAHVKPLFVAFIGMSLIASCNGSDFSGNSAKRAASADAKPEKDEPNDDKDGVDKGDKPLGTKSPGAKDNSKKPGTIGDTDDANNPGINSNVDNASGKPDSSLSDLLNGLLQTNNDVVATQPNDNTVIFGGGKVFHIGDNEMKDTSCAKDIAIYNVAGKVYYFEFDVKKDGADVTITMNRVCGVDYSDSNFVRVKQGNTTVAEQKVPKGATTITLQAAALAVGKYRVEVQSKKGTKDVGENTDDFDDFIVGEVQIQATKAIKAGTVGAADVSESI